MQTIFLFLMILFIILNSLLFTIYTFYVAFSTNLASLNAIC